MKTKLIQERVKKCVKDCWNPESTEESVRLKKDGTPDKRQFKYLLFGYNKKPPTQCQRPRRKQWVEVNKQEIRERMRFYRKENADHLSKKKKQYWDSIIQEVITAYGGKCQCCGESDQRFLTLEHVNGRSTHGRSSSGRRITGKKAMAQVKKLGFPKDEFQILCFNCNCAKGIYGICPHQIKEYREEVMPRCLEALTNIA